MTRGHCERVRAYSDLIGQQLGLDEESASKLHWAALLHDVGKLDVSPAVLNKKGRLTPEEWEHVRGHPAHSDRWIGGLTPWLGEWVLAASQHHERFDGQGYPYGIAGMDISLAGRIVSVADAFDVMTAARSYKKPFPAAQARVELTDNAGSQFDPQIVRAFLAISVGELRRVMGPIAWLAALPELVRASVTGALAPARTAVIAAGVAAASLVPAVSAPMHVVITPAANAASGAATRFVAAEEGANERVEVRQRIEDRGRLEHCSARHRVRDGWRTRRRDGDRGDGDGAARHVLNHVSDHAAGVRRDLRTGRRELRTRQDRRREPGDGRPGDDPLDDHDDDAAADDHDDDTPHAGRGELHGHRAPQHQALHRPAGRADSQGHGCRQQHLLVDADGHRTLGGRGG